MIYYTPRLRCCPLALKTARRANSWLYRNKLTSLTRVDLYQEALFDVDERGKVRGILVFFDEPEHGIYISIAWVDGRVRQRGVFKQLLAAIEHLARNIKAKAISTEVRSRNTRMLEVMSRHWDTSYVYFTKTVIH